MNTNIALERIEFELNKAAEATFLLRKNDNKRGHLKDVILKIQESLELAKKLEDDLYTGGSDD